MFSFYIFCLEATVIKQLDENKARHYYGNFFKSTILKLLDHSYVQSSFRTNRRHFDNGIWKTPYSWRFYGHGSSQILILFWVNIFKRKSTKVPGKLSFSQTSEPALQRTLHQDISLIIVWFFFSQKSLVFKFNLVLIR